MEEGRSMNQLSPQESVPRAFPSLTLRFITCATAAMFLALVLSSKAFALGQTPYVDTELNPRNFVIAHAQRATPIYVDPNDYPGVIRAVGDLQSDIQKVTGSLPSLIRDADNSGPQI